MTKEIQVFNQQEVLGKNFSIYGDAENPLFLAKDVAEWIEHKDVTSMLRNTDENEKELRLLSGTGQSREMWCLTEDGLYEVLMLSRKPIAKVFKKKVKEILKSIRKTGHYETPEYKLMLETKDQLEDMKKMLVESGVIRTNVNPRYTFDRLNVRYKIATQDDNHRGFYDSIGNYFGISVPYSSQINVTVKDWILSNVTIDDIQEFILGLETGTIVKSKRGYYVNLNGFGGNSVEWDKILDSFGHQCAYCGSTKALIPEHIVPQSLLSCENHENVDLVGNVCCSCVICNKSKGKHEMEGWFRKQPSFTEAKLRKIQRHQQKYQIEEQ